MAALSNLPYIERVRDALVVERGRLQEGLASIPYLEVGGCGVRVQAAGWREGRWPSMAIHCLRAGLNGCLPRDSLD